MIRSLTSPYLSLVLVYFSNGFGKQFPMDISYRSKKYECIFFSEPNEEKPTSVDNGMNKIYRRWLERKTIMKKKAYRLWVKRILKKIAEKQSNEWTGMIIIKHIVKK